MTEDHDTWRIEGESRAIDEDRSGLVDYVLILPLVYCCIAAEWIHKHPIRAASYVAVFGLVGIFLNIVL